VLNSCPVVIYTEIILPFDQDIPSSKEKRRAFSGLPPLHCKHLRTYRSFQLNQIHKPEKE